MKKTKVILLLTCILSLSFNVQRNQFNFNEQDRKNNRNTEPFFSDFPVGSYTVPGVDGTVPLDRIIKIGLLDDMNHVSGDHAWKGAKLAAREINEGGGILINGTQYYIGLVYENTDEANPNLDISNGIDAAQKMVDIHQPHFVIGGFKIESLGQYLEILMEKKIPFLCTGNGFDNLYDNVELDYSRYKYFFRVMPINGTASVGEFLNYILGLTYYLNTTYGGVDKIAIIREDKLYSDRWFTGVFPFLQGFGLKIVYEKEFSSIVTVEDFENYWEEIEAVDAQIAVFLTDDSSGTLMAQAYKKVKPQCLIISIDTQSEYETYWDDTEGGCQYIIRISHIHNTSITSLTIPYINKFFNDYDCEPYYPGTGSYNAINLLANATLGAQSFDSDKIVTSLEKINRTNYFLTPNCKFAFTSFHDVLEGWPYAVGFWKQWKYIDGTTELLQAGFIKKIYPDSLITGSLRIPPWGINNLIDDYSHKLPGAFILDIDKDAGKYNLSWTDSEGADNYSVYMSNENITYISKRFYLLTYQTSASSLSISGLKKGDYYIAVVAYNETGETISSNIVHISIPGFPIEIVIIIVICIIIIIPAGMIILKRKRSREELISMKDKQGFIGKKQKKSISIDSSKSVLSSRELEALRQIEAELSIETEQHICIVHGGKIIGTMYLCPKCESYYCMECATIMKNKGETCGVCKNEIELQ